MEYIIFCIVIFALIATLAFRPRIEKRKGEIKELNSADFSEGIRNLSRNNRLIVRGGEIRLEPLMGAILRAEKVILKKVYKDEAITEGEKWFYENIYRMKRFVGGFNRREFCKNPSAGNAIRVLELARFIVENSQKSLNFKRISEAVNGANEESPLTYQEILSLKSALGVAIAERIYILAKRISHYEKMKNLAEKRGILNARLNSDIYIYYLINSGKNPAVSDRLIKRGISLKSAEFNHASSLHETAKIAKYLFESLKNLNDILPENSLGSLLVSDKELSQDLSYKCASEDTKHIMLRGIFKIAEASNTHESFVVKKLLNLADYNKTDPANIIIKYPRALLNYVRSARNLKKIKQKSGAFPQRIYAGAVLGISLFLSALSFFLFRIWFLPLLVFVPSFITAETVLNYLLARAVREKRLPRMNFSAIPNEHSAMIVVSEFISEASQMSEAIKRLRAIRKANHDKNITVALLADLRASHNETDIKDAGIINEAKEARADENICIFIRKRRKTGEKFVAHERKRGAVMALTSALISGNFEEFLYVLNPSEKSPNYLIALDQDNVLDLNGAKEMINVIAHPANESYDLIASRPRYNLFSLKTVYSKRFLTESAYVNYPNYSSLYHNLFSRDIFTGKGIFRLKSFHEKLHKTLPEKKVLSHDIIEGAILKTSSTCTVYEDAPKNFISDRERRKRWARGDIQLLPFTKNSWKNEDNKPHKSAVLPLYKFIIWRNVFNLFLPIFLLALGVSALFFPRIGFALLFFLFTPFILDSFGVITSAILRRERLRYALKDILVSFGNSVLEISMIPYYALSNFKLISATLFKMLIGGNLLEWKTYSQSQGEKGFARFVREVSVSMLIAPIVSILLFFFVSGFSYIYAVAFGAFSYLCYAVMFLLGCEKKPREISEKDSTTLKDYAQKTYQYFKFMRETKGLIADNLQIKPYKGISKTTSPTNIGFQLISEVSGYLLGLCSFKEVLGIIEDAVSVCEGLEKWHGNLYNWYSVKDNSIAVPFVSSVDSGNFLACLIAVSEFLKQEGETSLASRIDNLINETDLSRLYDADKRQFYLGYNAKENIYEGHYDLLASESRLTSFIYSAMQNDPSHWKALIRDFSGEHGNTLLSWSGTMFEYLMPELFLITPKNSLCGISCKNAVKVQSRIKTGGVFGLSESGYYAFDDSLRYQYRAFGADKLALGRDKQKNVISPYSSVLSLEYAKRKSLKNLKKLSEIGAQGEYGFYEAVDMDGGARVVYSYMTHHQGMILASIANILTGGKIKEFMFKNSALRGGAILLTEPQNRGAHGYKAEIKEKDALKKGYEYFKSFNKLERICTGAGVTGGGISAYADSFGSGYTLFNGTYINRYARGSIGGAGGRHFYVKKDNDFVSPCFATMKDDLKNYSFHYTPSVITHQNNKGGVRLEITVDPYLQAEVLRLSAEGGGKKEIAFYEAIALADYGKQNAHPAFNGMFLSSEYDKDLNAVIIKRSLRKGEKPIYTALVVRGVENTVYETNRFNFLGRCRSENSPQFLDNETYENETKNISFGDILEPCFAFKGEMVDESCEVIKLFAESRETLIQNILKIPTDYFGFASESGGAHGISELANAMLYPLNSGAYNEKLLQDIDSKGKRDCFMKFTSGKKVLIYELGASQNLSPIKHIANAVNDLRQFDLYPKVVIILESNASSHRISYVEKLFKKHQVHATVLTPESLGEASADYAFLNLNNICAEVTHFYKNHMNDSGFSYENAELQSGDKIMPSPDMNAFKSGEGIFTTGVYRLPLRVKPLLPHSNVVALSEGGFIATENGGGLIFGANSYESRITRHDNDPVKDTPYERIFLEKNGRRSRINGGSRTNEVLYSRGRIRYLSTAGGKDNMLESYMVFNGKVKINEVKFWDQDSLIYCAEFILGTETGSPFIYAERVAEHMFKVKNMLSYQESFIRILGKHICESEIVQNGAEIEILAKLNICEADRGAKNIYIAIGSHNEISELSEEIILTKKAESLKYFNDLSPIKISTKDLSLNALFNDWLPYQVVSSRLNGRCGYYQLGGAIGYRDQLQDALALMQWDAPRVKKQILLHAEHQYSEGDVQHWWHPPAMGLRSKISDDKLFLPYVVAEYITATGDKNILEEAVPFLVSPPLGTHEHARYESPKITEEKFTIREHCARAIKSALKYGKHGLLLMGTGDWNDGLDFIGENGIGESVPLTMFCYETIVKYSKFLSEKEQGELNEIARLLKEAVNANAYENDRFLRLYGDDGRWYGGSDSKVLSIDIVSQSFSAISEIADISRVKTALKSAEELIDLKHGIIKLLSPPLNQENYLGYISAYPEGVRENGGQYTHGAIWYLYALLKIGETEKAWELFKMINPAEKCKDYNSYVKYKGEPYVISADIYSEANAGRMGWSWYTGSASWCYRLILEEFFGIKLMNGNRLKITPKLPKELSGAGVEYTHPKGSFRISFLETGSYSLSVNGKATTKDYIEFSEDISLVTVTF